MTVALPLVVAYPMVVAFSRAVFRSVYTEVLAASIHANLSFLALGALEYQLKGVNVAACAKSVADSMGGGESANGAFKGLPASLTVQGSTPVDPARVQPPIAARRDAKGIAGVGCCPGTWPPQILTLLCQCGTAPIKAVAPWAGSAILLKGIFRTCWLPAITELLQVTFVLPGATHLASWLHLAFMTAGTIGTLCSLDQLASGGITAGILTLLRCATVTLLSTLHKQVSTHRATHEPVDIWDIGQAACLGFCHE